MALNHGHPRLKEIRRLINDRTARRDGGLFVVEGPVLCLEALSSGLVVREVLAEEQIFRAGRHGELFGAIGNAGAEYTDVANGALEKVLSTRSPQPIAAVVETPEFLDASDLLDVNGMGAGRPILGLLDIADPGNLGTMLRTAEAAGVGGVIIAGSSVDVTNPKVVRASAGAMLRIPVAIESDLDALRMAAETSTRRVFNAVVSPDAVAYETCALGDALICMGNEAHGLPSEWTSAIGQDMTIHLAGPTESLNVAASAAIICFESLRQRREKKGTLEP